MPIKSTDAGTMITGDEIHFAQWLAIAYGLCLEIKTGMKASRGVSLIRSVNTITGGQARTKVQALADITLYTLVYFPAYEPGGRVTGTLGTGNLRRITAQAAEVRHAISMDEDES